ncbi:hypothetical protein L218DRAFT_1077916 [Marasmius fiardii PR-910]|nr:hypothetical protein L218DRAFT_1077916 [Marasmius fiardii PR-910]
MSKPKATHTINFPPFPAAPEGASITPFNDFQERGIQVHLLGEDDEELDGFGNATVALRTKHTTDKCKTDAKPRPAKAVAPVAVKKSDGTTTVRKKEWWEEWEENDKARSRIGYNPNEARSDRFHKAVSDFNRNRRWPPMTSHVREQWDQFQIFAGLLTSIPIWHKKTAKNLDNDDGASDSDSDDDDEEAEYKPKHIQVNKVVMSLDSDGPSSNTPKNQRSRPREPYGKGGDGHRPTIVENDEQVVELLDQAKEEKEDKLVAFLNDPVRGVKVFLSSYFRRQGFHYADRNLFIHPKLICIFLSYILRHRVLPDKEEETAIRKAKEIAELALEELPLTSKLAKVIPDDFNRALSVLFQVKKERVCWPNLGTVEDSEKPAKGVRQAQGPSHDKRDHVQSPGPDAKRVKLTAENDGERGENAETALFHETIKEGKMIEIVGDTANTNSGGAIGSEGDIQMVDATQDDGAAESALQSTSWGTSGSGGWGDNVATSQWGDRFITDSAANGVWGEGENPWGAAGDTDGPSWVSDDPTLFPLLGPTTLPMTHRTGIVEWSIRKVKKITLPDSNTSTSYQPCEATVSDEREYGNAHAVESELSRKLYRVEMEPWLGWGDSSQEEEGVLPRIMDASRGQVIIQSGVVFEDAAKEKVGVSIKKDDSMDVDSSKVYTSASGLRAYNTLEDTITVLMESSSVEHLRIGMGLGGTWVQLLRNGDIEDDPGLVSGQKKSKKKGKGTFGERYWYVDALMVTLTSYHTV